MGYKIPRLSCDPIIAMMPDSDYQRGDGEGYAVNRVSNRDLERRTGIGYQQWQRWRTSGGIPFWKADAVAVKMGLHPAFIWRMEYWCAWADSAELFDYEVEATDERVSSMGERRA